MLGWSIILCYTVVDMPHANIEERRAYARAYHLKNKAKKNEASRKWYHDNPELIREQRRNSYAKSKSSMKVYRENNKEKLLIQDKLRFRRNQIKKYGLDPTTVPEVLVCEVCASTHRVAFDHDHITNAFRGFLCNRCNVAVGMALDNPKLLEKMAKYLRDHNLGDIL